MPVTSGSWTAVPSAIAFCMHETEYKEEKGWRLTCQSRLTYCGYYDPHGCSQCHPFQCLAQLACCTLWSTPWKFCSVLRVYHPPFISAWPSLPAALLIPPWQTCKDFRACRWEAPSRPQAPPWPSTWMPSTTPWASVTSPTGCRYRTSNKSSLSRTSSQGTLQYFTALSCTVLYCTVLYCTVLYCTVLYCTVLYSTVLYFAVGGKEAGVEVRAPHEMQSCDSLELCPQRDRLERCTRFAAMLELCPADAI